MIPNPLDRLAASLIGSDAEDFLTPPGEPSVVPPESISWRVFANPVTMYIGGIAAVLLELGEPRVRHGVWDHSSFRRDPARRLQRTGLAAMVTVYGARSRFEALAARVRRMHDAVSGTTPDGQPYAANDPELLQWVQVTAAWGFLEAYARYARPLARAERDRYYAEARAGAALYGVEDPPTTGAAVGALFDAMLPRLGPSPILRELLYILDTAAILPGALRPMQRIATRAAVALVPAPIRARIGVAAHGLPRPGERALLTALARVAEVAPLPSSPAAQARRRMGERPATAADGTQRVAFGKALG